MLQLRTTAGRALGVGLRTPSLGWATTGIGTGFELETSHDEHFGTLRGSASGDGHPTWVDWPGPPLTSRERVHWRVRLRTADGWSDWSAAVLEAGLLEAADWTATFVGAQDDGVAVPRLRTTFSLDQPVRTARLYVTALGVHETSLNGRAVTEDVLAPGWTAYRHRVAYDTYDVTDLLVVGENELAALVGDGWYRGNLGWGERMHRCHYGDRTALLAQLEVELADGTRTRVATGPEGWTAATTEITSADLYHGTDHDLTLPLRPLPVGRVDADVQLVARQGPPVRRTAVFGCAPQAGLHDVGQNLAGWVRLRVRAQRGQTVTVRHAEVLVDGRLATEPLRAARCTDTWVLSEGEHELEPRFTFHGFRYVDISTDAEVLSVEAVAVHSDLVRTGTFACSDDRLNRLHGNVVWGQRGNFLSVPTDCPQRDERLGWTGDAQVFAHTAALLHDCHGFFADWLADLRLEQLPTGNVPVVVPNVLSADEAGVGGWADAAVVVPWQVAVRSGDLAVLRDSVDSMRSWVDFVAAQLQDDLWVTGFQLGDWLDPDAPPGEAWRAKADATMVGNAVFAHSVWLLAETLQLLGEDAGGYRDLARRVREKAWERWGPVAITTQTGCALFLRFGLVPDGLRQRYVDALADLVLANGGRIGTGFLGTPEVLFVLSDGGRLDAAYTLLMCEDCPSWLYQVAQGATTMWERWDAIRPDGSLNLGAAEHNAAGMLSFNHYAYGAVAAWLHEVVAGLSVRELPEPELVVAPRPGGGLSWASAALETPRGRASVHWDSEQVTVDVPGGYRAWLDLDGARVPLPAGRTVTRR